LAESTAAVLETVIARCSQSRQAAIARPGLDVIFNNCYRLTNIGRPFQLLYSDGRAAFWVAIRPTCEGAPVLNPHDHVVPGPGRRYQRRIYALLGLALVLVFAVTRVILIPQGEFVTYVR